MIRALAITLLLPTPAVMATQSNPTNLDAPAGWLSETIKLPPGFAPDLKLTGTEFIRFAPGMMNPDSDSFFCYAFVFDLDPKPVLTDDVLQDEFLKYYRGLCKAVLRGERAGVDPSKFSLKLQRNPTDSDSKKANEQDSQTYTATLNWVEPFATKEAQQLRIEIQTWKHDGRNFVFACVSPQSPDAAIWKQLRAIRQRYVNKQTEAVSGRGQSEPGVDARRHEN